MLVRFRYNSEHRYDCRTYHMWTHITSLEMCIYAHDAKDSSLYRSTLILGMRIRASLKICLIISKSLSFVGRREDGNLFEQAKRLYRAPQYHTSYNMYKCMYWPNSQVFVMHNFGKCPLVKFNLNRSLAARQDLDIKQDRFWICRVSQDSLTL